MKSATASYWVRASRCERLAASGRPKGGTGYSCSPRRCSTLAAGHEHDQVGRCLEKLGHQRGTRPELFEVVEHQEQAPISQMGLQGGQERSVRLFTDAQRGGDRGGDEGRIGEWGQVGEEDAADELRAQLRRDLQGEPGLAGPAGPGERQQAGVPDEIGNGLHFPLATDEVGHLGREVGRGLERARGRELLRQPRDRQLE